MRKTQASIRKLKTITKVTVCEAKLKAFKEVYDKLDSKEREKDRYWMVKRRQAKTNDIGVIQCVKDKNNYILVQDENIKNRWGSILMSFLMENKKMLQVIQQSLLQMKVEILCGEYI